MERITLPNAPVGLSPMDACLDYQYEIDGVPRYARVILEMSTGEQDHFKIKAQAFEMDADGNYKQAPKGYPSRTKQSNHTVPESSFAAANKTATLAPGWIKLPPSAGVNVNAESLPEGCTVEDELPVTGVIDQLVYVDGTVWKFDKGVARHTAEAKIEELINILANSAPLSNLGFDHAAI